MSGKPEKRKRRMGKNYTVRKAGMSDLPVLLDLYEAARQFMHTHGNPDQWNDGHPCACDLIPDIEQKILYVVEEDAKIQAAFVYFEGTDPTYVKIDGQWLNDRPYGVGHKVASSRKAKGLGHVMIQYLKDHSEYVRMDTHQDNLPMRRLLEKEGFSHCGTIYLKDGSPRMAYMFDPHQKAETGN